MVLFAMGLTNRQTSDEGFMHIADAQHPAVEVSTRTRELNKSIMSCLPRHPATSQGVKTACGPFGDCWLGPCQVI